MWREARSFLWDHEKATFTCTQQYWRNVDVSSSGALATLLAVRHQYSSVWHAAEHILWGSFALAQKTPHPLSPAAFTFPLPLPGCRATYSGRWHTACVSAGLGRAPLWLTGFWVTLLPNTCSDIEQAENIMKTWSHGGCVTTLWVSKTWLNVSICFCVTEEQNH